MPNVWHLVDAVLLVPYRLTGHPVADYFAGTFILALLAAAVGEFTAALVFTVNRRHVERLDRELAEKHALSLAALEAGDRGRYAAVNREANEAFGRVFFNMVALSAAYLWPVFFALAWMQPRFAGLAFPVPFTGLSVNYAVTFLVCYLLARLGFGRVKHRLPFLAGVHRVLAGYG
ncbi:MAG: hypothetical protein H5T97_04950, partial [Firmicutes bacterium]|nr:hypothetical protein [Bacillota bacterium]